MPDYENSFSSRHQEKYDDRALRMNRSNPVYEKIDNFWFHHKGKVIAAIIVLLIFVLIVAQYAGRRDSDVMVLYSGPSYLSGDQIEEFQNLMSVLYQKVTGENKVLIGLTRYEVYSKEQIESLRTETHEDGETYYINSEINSENYDSLYEYIMTGDTAVLFLDPWLYEELLKNNRLQPMSELFETLPASTDEKGYGIVLGETEIYEYYGVMQALPKNTVMCFLKPYVFGNTSKDDQYEAMKTVFRTVALFESPDD